ncbi:MAG: T9SS type A sorting domain-containing protein [Bacteroidetes bacterium]|nr:T9SS type A sorting domain-containing protein [Bacteroidota bacterium]
MATLVDGTTFPLSVVTSISEIGDNVNVSMHPNPVVSGNSIMVSNTESVEVSYEILNIQGQIAGNIIPANMNNYEISTKGINNGIYFVRTQAGTKSSVSKLVIN